MNKILVLYKSKYGYTKTYAEMIGEELACDIREASGISSNTLKDYDTIIYGGGLYALGINGIKLIKDNFDNLQTKNIIVWATGSNPGRASDMEQVWKQNFSDSMLKKIHTFYLRGGFDYQKLSAGHKLMMSLLKVRLKSMKTRSEDEEGLLKAYDTPEYHCDKENIAGLVEYVRGLERPVK